MKKFVYLFTDGNKDMKDILGGKGANLAEMTKLGLPIPPGFTITSEACNDYYDNNEEIRPEIVKEIFASVKSLEKKNHKKFGNAENPLLLSVRSGARASMPGMMDTILNLGLNDETVEGFAKITNNPRFAYDSYRRFIQMYADVVMNIDKDKFEAVIEKVKSQKNIQLDRDLAVEDLQEIIREFKKIYRDNLDGAEFPQDVLEQLKGAVKAVFASWNNERAIVYRRMNDIPKYWGTAVNVQTMVFGNMNNFSGTGVAFTRNPATGEKGIYGEYLINAQGEDVVAGIRTPEPIQKLEEIMPDCYQEFLRLANLLEDHYRDMQDMEFTIENGHLYFLQTRNGKRTALASIKIACDLVKEGKITEKEALMRIDAKSLDQLLHPTFDKSELAKSKWIVEGLPASPGAAAGKVVFTSEEAKKRGANQERVILVRLETTPEDIEGMVASAGLLTVRGGRTSHAAVVARGMGKCCISGCSEIIINEQEKYFKINDLIVKEGDYLSLDGTTGKVYLGDISTVPAQIEGDFLTIMTWADKYRKLGVRVNADNPKDLQTALDLGCEGVGLCRTEHMFFDANRIVKMREMILAQNKEERERALLELLQYQKEDFKKMFKLLKGRPLTVRYLDPPLHEFLPKTEEEMLTLAKDLHISLEAVQNKCQDLYEFNPMMGHRGCRLAITYPEIAVMQTKALIEAQMEVEEEQIKTDTEIMIPLIGDERELKYIKDIILQTIKEIEITKNRKVKYHLGTMIEVPRAALLAGKIAEEAEFFSFGTNDLTQMTFGFSRDDASKFLNDYYQKQIYDLDPFARIDEKGVGELMKIAIAKSRKVRPDIQLGICGEHGGDPKSIMFCHELDLDYVSCSTFRIPIAKLAAAQASIREKANK